MVLYGKHSKQSEFHWTLNYCVYTLLLLDCLVTYRIAMHEPTEKPSSLKQQTRNNPKKKFLNFVARLRVEKIWNNKRVEIIHKYTT